MHQVKIFALHGFLGLPADWDFLPNVVQCPISPQKNFFLWAKQFNQWVKEHPCQKRVLLGYSLGGRLALHALLDQPTLWNQAIVISTHPGLKDPEEKKKRLLHDTHWAQAFCAESWDVLMESWEGQEIFKEARMRLKRQEKDYCREDLACLLKNFSLGNQEDLLPDLSRLSQPIRWITGANDLKFEGLAQQAVKSHSHSTHLSIAGGSHRVHLEYPDVIKKEIDLSIFS